MRLERDELIVLSKVQTEDQSRSLRLRVAGAKPAYDWSGFVKKCNRDHNAPPGIPKQGTPVTGHAVTVSDTTDIDFLVIVAGRNCPAFIARSGS